MQTNNKRVSLQLQLVLVTDFKSKKFFHNRMNKTILTDNKSWNNYCEFFCVNYSRRVSHCEWKEQKLEF